MWRLSACTGEVYLHAVEQREKIANLQKQLNLIETTIVNLGHISDIPLYSVALKKFPAHYVIRNCREIICIFLESMLIYVMNEFSDSGGHFHGT